MKKIDFGSNKDFEVRAINLKKIMIELAIADPNLIKGCNQQEIARLEQENNVTFPKSYKVFLEHFGHGLGGRVMNDCDILYDDIFSLTDTIRNEILIEEGDPVLPDKAFVFSGRYNEQFMFFDASGLENEPNIMYYMIDEDSFRKIGESIFDFIGKSVENMVQIKLYRERNRRK